MFFSLLGAGMLQAQVVDDVYYDPDKDRVAVQKQRPEKNPYESYEEDGYAAPEDEYDYYNDYDYYYTSRIRRFHRPYYGFNYFDPIYVDAFHYDRFLAPGVSVLIYDDYYSNRFGSSFNRWNRWNSWGPGLTINIFNNWNNFGGFNSWGWDPWYGSGFNSWNRWNRFNAWNSWGYGGPYLYNSVFAYPPTWGNGYQYNTVITATDDNHYFGPRTGGSATGPAPGARPGRAPGIIDNSPGATAPRTIQTTGGRITESDRTRVPATTGSSRDLPQPTDRISPQSREINRYPATPRQTETGRTFGTDRAAPANRDISNPGVRATPAPRTTTPSTDGTYNRAPRTTAPQPSAAPRSYAPATRTYERSGSSSFDRPSGASSGSSFDRPRSSSGFDSPRSSYAPSGGGSAPASVPRSAPAPSSSSSGGRVRN